MSKEIIASIIGAGATIAAGLLVYLLSRGYYRHSQKIEKHRLLKELFKEFNERYDVINNELDNISRLTNLEWAELSDEDKKEAKGIVIDFFNICAEEYYWYTEKSIDEGIWSSWQKGMNDIFNRSEIILQIWDDECKNDGFKSYYINKKYAFFKEVVY